METPLNLVLYLGSIFLVSLVAGYYGSRHAASSHRRRTKE